MFTKITILILDHNYLDNIDGLSACKELVKLDIHSNQVRQNGLGKKSGGYAGVT